jgi:hypothetical protein
LTNLNGFYGFDSYACDCDVHQSAEHRLPVPRSDEYPEVHPPALRIRRRNDALHRAIPVHQPYRRPDIPVAEGGNASGVLGILRLWYAGTLSKIQATSAHAIAHPV